MLILPFNQAVKYHVLAGINHFNFLDMSLTTPPPFFGQCPKLSRFFTWRAFLICFLLIQVFYCGSDCQKAAREDHRAECQNTRGQYKTVRLNTGGFVNMNYQTKKTTVAVENTKKQPSKKHFIVKVQVPMKDRNGDHPGEMSVYNEDKSVMGVLKRESNEAVFDDLIQTIKDRGFYGMKAFFYAIHKTGQDQEATSMTMKINSEVVLPIESW